MKSQTSFQIFFLKEHSKNSLKNIVFPRESVFTTIAKIPQGLHTAQIEHCACSEAYFKDLVRLPVAGYLVSAVHALKGNDSHALRAAGRFISCTNFLASCSMFAKS